MRQLQIVAPGELALAEVAEPECGAADVIVEVAACGICGSDFGYLASGGLPGSAGGMALGHEFAGHIVARGSAVDQWAVGQAVVVNPLSAANMIGNGGSEGAFAPRVSVRMAQQPGTLFAIPVGLGVERAALAEPLAVAFHALEQVGAHAGVRAVVLGGGPIGLACVIALRQLGAADVVVVERVAARAALARQLGADLVLDNLDETGWQQLVERHGVVPFYGQQLPASEVFVDCAGAAILLEKVIAHAAPHSRLVIVAVHGSPVALDLAMVMAKELQVSGALGYGDCFPQALACLAELGERIKPYVSHCLPLSRFGEAFALAADPAQAAKVLLVPD